MVAGSLSAGRIQWRKFREGFLEDRTSEMNLKGKGKHSVEVHLPNHDVYEHMPLVTTRSLWSEHGKQKWREKTPERQLGQGRVRSHVLCYKAGTSRQQ